MKKTKKISMEAFRPSSKDVILLDTNILIELFYPINFKTESNGYDVLYSKMCSAKSNLIISSIQLSEFINRCIRIQFNLYKSTIGNMSLDFKKDYRSSDDYRDKMNAILDIVKTDIYPTFQSINDNFDKIDSDKIYKYGFSYDFNDAILIEIAKIQNAIIVTNDSDFGNYGNDVSIVTNNQFLLRLN